MSSEAASGAAEKKSPLREIVQPFIDLVHAPRALWGINIAYFLEGLCYFGVLNYLTIYFSDFVFRGIPSADEYSHSMVMVLTAGITISMFLLGFVPDKIGFRPALLIALGVLVLGRSVIASGPTILGLQPHGIWSPLHLVIMVGIVIVVIGYGMFQPAAYAGVRRITTPKTASMAFGMLYALMNLGIFCTGAAFLLRDKKYLGLGIPGTYWVYAGLTIAGLLAAALILSHKTVAEATARARQEAEATEAPRAAAATEAGTASGPPQPRGPVRVPPHLWLVPIAALLAVYFRVPGNWRYYLSGAIIAIPLLIALLPAASRAPIVAWIARHPMANARFFFFLFSLMPVQTLFAYNWLILPQYLTRAFSEGWIAEKFEFFLSLNALLIFILVPIITAVTQGRKVYNMIVLGTLVMAAPAFVLAIGPHPWTLFTYIAVMTVGEAMWQPRFLQYAAEIAPEGRTGQYMGMAQLPWFMTKMLVPLLYSGRVLEKYCPAQGPQDTRTMWLIFACVAAVTPTILLLGKTWVNKDFRTQAA